MVTRQGGSEHVGSVVMSEQEAIDFLVFEARLHEAAGWTVSEIQGVQPAAIRATKNEVERVIFIRHFDPMEDA